MENKVDTMDTIEINSANHKFTIVASMLDDLDIAVWQHEYTTGILRVNKRWATILGYTYEELQPLSTDFWLGRIHPQDKALVLANNKLLIQGHKEFTITEYRIQQKSGNWVWVHERARITEWESPEKPKLIGGTLQNITKTKLAEQALLESEKSKSILLSNLPGMSYRCAYDEYWTMEYVSQGCLELTGYEPHELLYNKVVSFNDLILPKHQAKLANAWELGVAENRPVREIYQIITKDGSKKWVWEQGFPIYHEDGTVRALEGLILDITERKVAETALSHSIDLMRYVIEHNSSAVAIHDRDLRYLYVSQRYLNDYKVTDPDIIGKHHYEVFPDIPQKWRDVHQRALLGEVVRADNDIYIREDGSKEWTRWECRPWYESDGEIGGIIVYTEVITDRKLIEEQLRYLSNHDYLTSLYNRKFLEEELVRRENEKELPLTVVMVDTNGLKLVNDSFGHERGDEMLKRTARVLTKGFREQDTIARYGGDEFIILLSNTDELQTEKIIANINALAANEQVASLQLSMSFGYETRRNLREDFTTILKKAEDNMYRNKLYESTSAKNKSIGLIMNTLFAKSTRESLHSKRVSELCESIAKIIGFSPEEVKRMRIAGLMHDIGKIGVEENILNKPGKLTPDEWEEMKRHPETGFRIVATTSEFSEIARYILEHQERWDGKGYPRGLSGTGISIQARIIAIADAYDAMTSDRPYRKGLSTSEAIEELRRCSGTQFDPTITQQFIEKALPLLA